MSGQFNDFGIIIPAFILLAALWALAVIYIWYDADEHYGTGWFWLLLTLFAPYIAIPAYGLMKLGTHRNWREEQRAQDRLDFKRNSGQRFSGLTWELQQRLEGGTRSNDEDYGCVEVSERVRFRPFRHTFAPSAERLRLRAESMVPRDGGHGAGAADGEPDGSVNRPVSPVSSQDCGDRLRDRNLNERLSWRERNVGVRSRWASPGTGTGMQIADRDEVPF